MTYFPDLRHQKPSLDGHRSFNPWEGPTTLGCHGGGMPSIIRTRHKRSPSDGWVDLRLRCRLALKAGGAAGSLSDCGWIVMERISVVTDIQEIKGDMLWMRTRRAGDDLCWRVNQ